jgi:hypothetical protein
VHHQNVSSRVVYNLRGRGAKNAIQSVVAVASDDRELGVELVTDLKDKAPRSSYTDDRGSDGGKSRSRAQMPQLILGFLSQMRGKRVSATSCGARGKLRGDEDGAKGVKDGSKANRDLGRRVEDTRGPW